jgi:peptidyl-prolyl cis-trans isomerase C
MSNQCSIYVGTLLLGMCGGLVYSQDKGAPSAAPPSTPQATPVAQVPAVAASVNGQEIPEIAVQRGLKKVPADKQAEARAEIVNFLIDNVLIDQYLLNQKIEVASTEVEAKWKEVQAEVTKRGSTMDKMLKDLMLTPEELKMQIGNQLRWDKFAESQATEQRIRQFFDAKRELFNGSMVRARHILLSPPQGDAKANADARAKLMAMKKQVEDAATQGLAKLPPQTPKEEIEKVRGKLIEDTFAELAKKESACPSKAQGGNLEWFPYSSMVEPFAKAAFSLKPYQMSDVVSTQFGQHLILVTDRKEGKEPKFEEVKDDVKEVYCDQLREALCSQLKPTARIIIAQPPEKPGR